MCRPRGIWTLQAGIFPENGASRRLHETCGFRVAEIRELLGKLRGSWRDVLLVERRSPSSDESCTCHRDA